MPPKLNRDSTRTDKALGVLLLLLFTGRTFTVKQLMEYLDCSKQTVIGVMKTLEGRGWAELEISKRGRENCYQIKAEKRPNFSFSAEDLAQLALCRDLVLHLLPKGTRENLNLAVGKAGLLVNDMDKRNQALAPHGRASAKGSVDYTPFQDMINILINAAQSRSVCQITYHAVHNPEPKTYYFAPMRINSFHDSLYMAGYIADVRGTPELKGQRRLAIHRFRAVEPLAVTHDFPDIEDEAENTFGFMGGEKFKAKIRFSAHVAGFVAEKTWSDDQEVIENKDKSVDLCFTASNMQEVASWVLSFSHHAEVLEPQELREDMARRVRLIGKLYQ